MNVYHRKLYALLHDPQMWEGADATYKKLQCFKEYLDELQSWWQIELRQLAQSIGSSCDQVNWKSIHTRTGNLVEASHPSNGEFQSITEPRKALEDLDIWETVKEESCS